MQLKNEFEVDADLERTWTLLTDLEQVMPCLPGAVMEGRDGENYLGSVKIKVGPIGANFKGSAHFAHKDDAAHTAVISASGKDPKGQAATSANIHARLEPVTDTRTRVVLDTDLEISGRMAQFGRGAIADVSNRLLGQFAANIGALLEAPAGATAPAGAASAISAAGSAGTSAPAASFGAAPAANQDVSMNAMSLVLPILKERLGPPLIGGLIGFALSWIFFGRKRRSQAAPPFPAWPPMGPWYDETRGGPR